LLTGLAMVVMHLLGVRLGFTFSAGAIDYVLNFNLGARGWLLIPIGLLYSALYYGLFRVCISVFKLPTPGREPQAAVAASPRPAEPRGGAFARALGGQVNLLSVDACTTRLRLRVADQKLVDEAALRALGARGFVRPDASTLQVVLGPIADQVASELRAALASPAAPAADAPPDALAANLLSALGGSANVRDLQQCSTRIRVGVADEASVSIAALRNLAIRGLAVPEPRVLHIILGPNASAITAALHLALAVPRT
jgi:PTS system N-acetylglucosamine-specific IIC component